MSRPIVLKVHRCLSLSVLAIWIVQAASGVFAVFHWEIDDLTIAGAHRPTDLHAIERRVASFAPPESGRRISSIWTTAAAPDRWDVYVESPPPEGTRVIRIDGSGAVLRIRSEEERFVAESFVETGKDLHQSLLAGDAGRWIGGVSGILLLSNLALGLAAAWPRVGQWGRALRPAPGGGRPAWLYARHRALGLWFVLPAFLIVLTGVLLAFEHTTARVLDPHPVQPPPQRGPHAIGMARAVETALSRYPDAAISGIRFPTESGTWRMTLRQQDEWRRAYGKTRVFVSAVDGSVVAESDALATPPGRRILDSLFAFHTGEVAGLPGRIVVFGIGLWLLVMIALGLNLWAARRRLRRTSLTQPAPAPVSES